MKFYVDFDNFFVNFYGKYLQDNMNFLIYKEGDVY